MDENKDRTKTKIETENKDINKKGDKNKPRQYQRQNLQIKLLFPPGNHRETNNAKVLGASWHWWLAKEVGAPLAQRRLLTFYRIGLDGTQRWECWPGIEMSRWWHYNPVAQLSITIATRPGARQPGWTVHFRRPQAVSPHIVLLRWSSRCSRTCPVQ